MLSTAPSFIIDDDDRFCNVVYAEPPRNTAEASIIVSTAHTTVETTVASEKNPAQKSNSSNERHRRLDDADIRRTECGRTLISKRAN
jgi:hypothetical protein